MADRQGGARWRCGPSLLAAALLAAGLPACLDGGGPGEDEGYAVPLAADSPWPKFRRNARQTARIADRTFYALTPDGDVRWTVPTGEIIDSAGLLDDRGRVYFGSGDGKLRARDAATGDEIWTFEADDPSVNNAFIRWFEGNVAITPGGDLFVPNDNWFVYSIDRDDGAALLFTTQFGTALVEPPAEIEANAALAFSLSVRTAGDTRLALIDSPSVAVDVDPPVPVRLDVSGGRRFLTVTPLEPFRADPDGRVTITVGGDYLVDLEREAARIIGGRTGGTFASTFAFALAASEPGPPPYDVPVRAGDPAAVWALSRLAAPLPTILPSYNQIGFDALHFLVGMIAGTPDGNGVAWFVGAHREEGADDVLVDPESRVIFPLEVSYDAGRLTMGNEGGMALEIFNTSLQFATFRLSTQLDGAGVPLGEPRVHVTLVCGELEFFAVFLRDLGFCNPTNDELVAYGAVELDAYDAAAVDAGSAGDVLFGQSGDRFVAAFQDSPLKTDEHRFSLAVLDADSGRPVVLDYGTETVTVAHADGTVDTVELNTAGAELPARVRLIAVVDTSPVAATEMTVD